MKTYLQIIVFSVFTFLLSIIETSRLNKDLFLEYDLKTKIMIKVENLSYTYSKSKSAVLHKLNFEIDKGEIFGFLGPSGAGKSTTQKVLYKILHNFEGEISIKDKPLKAWEKTILNESALDLNFRIII